MLKKQKLKKVCSRQLDVLPHISIQKFRQPDSESFVFYLTAERPEDKSIEDVFCLLLEREEYAEASREWNMGFFPKLTEHLLYSESIPMKITVFKLMSRCLWMKAGMSSSMMIGICSWCLVMKGQQLIYIRGLQQHREMIRDDLVIVICEIVLPVLR